MKVLFCILIIGMIATSVYSQVRDARYQNVFATSGIKLRTTPSTQSQSIDVIPFGERVEVLDTTDIGQVVEWFEGNWLKVRYFDKEGYVFSGFISSLPVPYREFEITQNDMDLSYPLLAWAEYHFEAVKPSDTLITDHVYKEIHYLRDGIILQREESAYHFKIHLTLPSSGISDAYNLLRSMMLSKNEIESFDRSSVFISHNSAGIDHIKVELENPVEIRSYPDGRTEISVVAFHEGCAFN